MTTTNLTEGGNQKSSEDVCSSEFTAGIYSQLIVLSVVNSFLSISAFVGNTLILVALHRETSLHLPAKILYCNLATTDLCVGIIAQPLAVVCWMSQLNERWNICPYAIVVTIFVSHTFCSVSLFTLTAISMERLLALFLGPRYRQVATLKRTNLTVTVFWVISILGVVMNFWNVYITFWFDCLVTSMFLVTSIFCYTKFFLTLRHHHIQVQDLVHQGQPSQVIPLNMRRYRKALSSTLWIQLTLVVCYVPDLIMRMSVVHRRISSSVYLARCLTSTLIFLNSSLNPFLYCWKIREIRQAVRDTIGQLGCSLC